MGSCGAPVVAVTDGVMGNLTSGGNAGIAAYLRAGNDVFAYMHLRSYAPGLSGARVSVGQKIGVNGTGQRPRWSLPRAL